MRLIDRSLRARTVRAAREAFAQDHPDAEIVLAHRDPDERRDVRVVGRVMTAADRALVDRVELDRETGRYFDPADARSPAVGDLDFYWTAFCGGCGEEIDVVARSASEARAIVEAAIAVDYEPIEIDQIERRFAGLMYF